MVEETDFEEIFDAFLARKAAQKVFYVGSASKQGKPNSAPKMLVDIVEPDKIYFLEYTHTQTYANIRENPHLSLSFMDDEEFLGYRLNGASEVLHRGKEFDEVRKSWEQRLIRYEADRIIKRITGRYSARTAENVLPPDFVIVRFTALEGSVVMPGRVLRARHSQEE